MHEAPKDLQAYREELDSALENSFLRQTLDNFVTAYRTNREAVFKQVDGPEIIAKIADVKDYVAQNFEALYEQFKKNAQARGVKVHRAATAAEANEIIANIAAENNVKRITKSKSMTSEETCLNDTLLAKGFIVDETDLGEWIIQLRDEPPSHMVMPAIHLSRYEVAEDFSKATGVQQDSDVQHLVKVARKELRPKYVKADMGITGANFAVAETGTIATVTNEGNARLVSTLPRVHVALIGLDKLLPTLDDALNALLVLPRNATAQMLTAYVSWINGANACATTDDGKKIMHIVFLDNGRSALAKDELFSQIFRCVRCGACANVCPVYRLVGGHRMGYIYIGAIGLILTYFFHGRDKAKVLAQNCINCEACRVVCAGGIDLPRLIREIRVRLNEEEGTPKEAALLSSVMKNRKMFHSLLKFAKFAQLPVTGGGAYQRHLPAMFFDKHSFKKLPAIASKSFRDRFKSIQPKLDKPRYKVALFAGCAQDFVYPEQLEACVKLLAAHNVAVDFPMEQSCCGLPLEMMGQRATSKSVAVQNLKAFDAGSYDAIVTLCASCAGHLKRTYPEILEHEAGMAQRCAAFTGKVMDFSSFVHNVLGVKAEDFTKSDEKVTYHASCHLCRGLGVMEEPRALIGMTAEYVPSKEEDVCCGFGGSYSMKFPEISATLLDKKLTNAAETGATRLVVDCPGCVMQIRGGAEKREQDLKVTHISELLFENLKK